MNLIQFNIGLDRVADSLCRIADALERLSPLDELLEGVESKVEVFQTTGREAPPSDYINEYLPTKRRTYGDV